MSSVRSSSSAGLGGTGVTDGALVRGRVRKNQAVAASATTTRPTIRTRPTSMLGDVTVVVVPGVETGAWVGDDGAGAAVAASVGIGVAAGCGGVATGGGAATAMLNGRSVKPP